MNNDNTALTNTLINMGVSEKSLYNYKTQMNNFLKCINVKFEDLINTIKAQQKDKIVGDSIIRYNVNDSLLKKYYDKYIAFCRKKGNKESTINTSTRIISSILKYHEIETPNKFKFNNKVKKTYGLSKEDIAHIINNYCNIHQKALIAFTASTGIRREDALRFTIKDFLISTYDYHGTYNLNKFLEDYNYNMVGYWKFQPKKTIKSGLWCKTCNSRESSNYIIESLKERQIAINNYNETHDDQLELNINSALFSNKANHYIGFVNLTGMSNTMTKKNKRFQDYKIKSLNYKLDNGEIDPYVHEDIINNLPKFTLHQLRHYFITVLTQYMPNLNIRTTMEAHTPPVKTDINYVNDTENDKHIIREAYNKVEKYLTFDNSFILKENNELLKDYEELKREVKEYKNMEHNLSEEYKNMEHNLSEITKKYNETNEKLKLINDFVDIFVLEEGVTDFNKLKRVKL